MAKESRRLTSRRRSPKYCSHEIHAAAAACQLGDLQTVHICPECLCEVIPGNQLVNVHPIPMSEALLTAVKSVADSEHLTLNLFVARAAMREACGVQFSEAKPSETGFYWYRFRGSRPGICEIRLAVQVHSIKFKYGSQAEGRFAFASPGTEWTLVDELPLVEFGHRIPLRFNLEDQLS